jgi:hypothetical protein
MSIDTTTNVQDSYSHAPIAVRDLTTAFEMIQKQRPALIMSALPILGMPATNVKHEWLNDTVAPTEWTLTGAYTAADGDFTVADSDAFNVGMILEFEDATTQKTPNMTATVTAITNATTVAITMSGTDTNLANGSTVKLIADPREEGSSKTGRKQTIPVAAENYTQIFSKLAEITGTQASVNTYGNVDLSYHEQKALMEILYELNQSVISGKGNLPTNNATKRTMKGIRQLIVDAGGLLDASGSALSIDLFNSAIQKGMNAGALDLNTAIANPAQAKYFRKLNDSGDNPVVTQDSQVAGNFVEVFKNELGGISKVFYDRNRPKDKIAIVDINQAGLVPLQNRSFFAKDATQNGDDAESSRIIGEYTLQLKNASTHVLIDNLEVVAS